ncbi:site-2 protease family protein [Paenibacillus apiarius]|uniref:Site-2 protease family protein n=1 Tax=Paenibacillus apiarius TaxID=46240 RepID=A0ABT4DL10_9BACL|nr:site-2 protease family protein [Paenibacillus apiarius]MBN3525890.1 site-2 protease family protein [Paenibacillus apiarius]MCY9513514.1 site-2 protease family protein [Paenibacillus apiarius]MCY9518065.1 site-2 protease family protein [Paenibacillus apiarius]MCY9551534.1 site-2 protease family protein [Paenibacillus apiarius]MCY9558688.1 site-2 protease family protein [Paenibacillus apiarius]
MDFLNKIFFVELELLPFLVLVLLVAFTVHEFAHAFFAWKFGDPTAKMLGRVSLNPTKHIDFLGLLFFVIAGFGWAKPVPVNRDNFKHPRLMSIVVSAAGPLSNLLLAFIGTLLFHLGLKYGFVNLESSERWHAAVYYFLNYFITFNVLLFLFNLIPLPPLDGYRIIEDLAPRQIRIRLQQFEQWSIFIFLLIVFIPGLRNVTIQPLFSLIEPIVFEFSKAALFLVGR